MQAISRIDPATDRAGTVFAAPGPVAGLFAGKGGSVRRRGPQRIAAAIAVALHALVATGLLLHEPARTALLASAPIMVDLITPPRPPEVKPPPPRPRPAERPKPVEQPLRVPVAEPPPLITAAASAPSPVPAPPPPPPAPVIAPTPAPVIAAPAAPPAPPAPLPIVPPVFNADYLENPAPAYPTVARRMGEQGRVVLRVLVNSNGRADEVQLQASSGSARLDDSARETVRRWKFVPARRGREPVAAWVLIPISFRLEG